MTWGGGTVAALGMAILASLALPQPSAFEPRLPLAPTPPLLEVESVYPSPLRTALEIEPMYVARAPERELVALTFDTEIPRGGEARQTVNEILDVLRQEKVHATFFVVGTWARANADVLRRMVAEGHEIANHSLDHRPFARRRASDIERDLDTVAELVERETGTAIAPLFRPPYGCVDTTAAQAARRQGYTLVGWTATGRDAEGDTESGLDVVSQVDADLAAGAVVLLHTNRWITAAALPLVLDRAREKGLAPTTLSAVLQADESRRNQLTQRASRRCGTLFAGHAHPRRRA